MKFNYFVLAVIVGVFLFAVAAGVQATALGPTPAIDMEQAGLDMVAAGAGFGGDKLPPQFPATINISIGGPVVHAILYWGGGDAYPGTPGDADLVFDGTPVAGTLTGTEIITDTQINLTTQVFGYAADVTSIVQAKASSPGSYSFVIQDGNTGDNADRLGGASLVVLFTDPTDTAQYRILIFEGADFAFDSPRFSDPENLVTSPVTFNYPAATSVTRTSTLLTIGGLGEPGRSDQLDISDNPSQSDVFNESDGPEWNTDLFSITVPPGVNSTTVQAVSTGATADSFVWMLAGMRVQTTTSTAVTLSQTATTVATQSNTLAGIALIAVGLIFVGAYIRRQR